MTLAQEDKALDYIVMDWENLYDVRRKKAKSQPQVQSSDSLNLLLNMGKAMDSTRTAASSSGHARKGSFRGRKTDRTRSYDQG